MRGSPKWQMIAIWAYVYSGDHHLHYDEPILRGDKDWTMPHPDWESAFEYEGRWGFWIPFACLAGVHCQVNPKKKYMDEDGAIFMAAVNLMAKGGVPSCTDASMLRGMCALV